MGRRTLQLVTGCVVLGVGVALLLAPALGSDGFSTFVNGLHLATGMPFLAANTLVSAGLIGLGWVRGVRPGPGTIVQVVTVGSVVPVALRLLGQPESLWGRGLMVAVAFPVLAVGIAMYLDTHLGAGPAEAPSLAWDPPVPFAVTYSIVQGGGALVGWQLGAAIGPGTVAVILLLGPAVAYAGRVLRLDLSRGPTTTPQASSGRSG